jgi:mono/diheme cytochrome c family protein
VEELKMKRLAIALLVLPFASISVAQDSAPPAAGAYKVPDDLMGKTNPVKPTPDGLAHAKKMYGYDCAMCHGATGDGKGDIPMKTPLKDLSDPTTLASMSDGEMFYLIQKGKGDMPPEGDRGKDADIWNIVAYVRSLAKK